jgi:sulfite reductase beta subunit-like hemoprotein
VTYAPVGIRAELLKAAVTPGNSQFQLTACPGFTVCSNAFTNSPALALAILQTLTAGGSAAFSEPLKIRVSGCTNGCALHVVADIGLEGLARALPQRLLQIPSDWRGV